MQKWKFYQNIENIENIEEKSRKTSKNIERDIKLCGIKKNDKPSKSATDKYQINFNILSWGNNSLVHATKAS